MQSYQKFLGSRFFFVNFAFTTFAAYRLVVVGGTSKTGIAAIRLSQDGYGTDINWAVVDIK